MRKLILLAALLLSAAAAAQNVPPKPADFIQTCDSLRVWLKERTGVDETVQLKSVSRRSDGALDFRFTSDLGFYPWRKDDVAWFKATLSDELSKVAKGWKVGEVLAKYTPLKDLVLPEMTSDGTPLANAFRKNDPRLSAASRFVEREDGRRYPKGLSDRYIALWQSHGRYYNGKDSLWRWQRATLHRTVEDMYTQSYVLPMLIPMLENAGAYVMTPRERDTQRYEIVCDMDKSFGGPRPENVRQKGAYSEKGAWSDAGTGFADAKRLYRLSDNPFKMGSCRKASCSPDGGSQAKWTPTVPKRGSYAVYVSYTSQQHSCTAARYTVHHLGGDTVFKVNQKRASGTWVYLGTFEFDEGNEGWVTLDSKGAQGEVVVADAVKFGGGYGKVNRGGSNSGLPAYAEGALYSHPWFGVDSTIYCEKETDYIRDYYSRGMWVDWMRKQKNVPFDVSLAFHSDAGLRQNDTIVGTLAIHTVTDDVKSSRLLCDMVQTQLVGDIRATFEPEWTRRGLWDKSYAETRTPGIPAMILETLSHQNFADMKYGLDPAFRFLVSRAAYKGLLKFTSAIYGAPYAVQPLPVKDFAVRFSEDGKSAVLSWTPTEDPLEPTAEPSSYIVQARMDDGVFVDNGEVETCSYQLSLKAGHTYSFRVVAVNDGGCSFPSEVLSIGRVEDASAKPVLIVNNFDRVSAPAWIDTPGYAGFLGGKDGGVPYISDLTYIGENYEFDRTLPWVTDDNPGFGASHSDKAGTIVAGNTFDFPAVHGKALMELGVPFCSMSRTAFEALSPDPAKYLAADIICGKQATTKRGSGHMPECYQVFPSSLKKALTDWTAGKGSILISGANIASDSSASESFTSKVLGYKMASFNATDTGELAGAPRSGIPTDLTFKFPTRPNPDCYCIERPDGLTPAGNKGRTMLRYTGTGTSAAVLYREKEHLVFAVGVPIECIGNGDTRKYLFKTVLDCLREP